MKSTDLVLNSTVNRFDGIFFKLMQNCRIQICTVWKNEKFSLTKKIFRQINSLVTYLVKPLLSRNFCSKSVRGFP